MYRRTFSSSRVIYVLCRYSAKVWNQTPQRTECQWEGISELLIESRKTIQNNVHPSSVDQCAIVRIRLIIVSWRYRIITSAPKLFFSRMWPLTLNLHTHNSRRTFSFSLVCQIKGSIKSLHPSTYFTMLANQRRNSRSLCINCSIIKPSFRSNLGIFRTFLTESNQSHELS